MMSFQKVSSTHAWASLHQLTKQFDPVPSSCWQFQHNFNTFSLSRLEHELECLWMFLSRSYFNKQVLQVDSVICDKSSVLHRRVSPQFSSLWWHEGNYQSLVLGWYYLHWEHFSWGFRLDLYWSSYTGTDVHINSWVERQCLVSFCCIIMRPDYIPLLVII